MSGFQIVQTVLWGALSIVVFVWLARKPFYRARLLGMQTAADSLIMGISRHFEERGEPIPDVVAKALDDMQEVKERRTYKTMAAQYERKLIGLGDALGKAAWNKGFDAGKG